MAYANLSEAVKSSAFETLSPEAKQHVFDTYSAKDEAYQGLSAEAKAHVQETYLGNVGEKIKDIDDIDNKDVKVIVSKPKAKTNEQFVITFFFAI